MPYCFYFKDALSLESLLDQWRKKCISVASLSSSQPKSSVISNELRRLLNFWGTHRHRIEELTVPGAHEWSCLGYFLAVTPMNNELVEIAYVPVVVRVTEILLLNLTAQNWQLLFVWLDCLDSLIYLSSGEGRIGAWLNMTKSCFNFFSSQMGEYLSF